MRSPKKKGRRKKKKKWERGTRGAEERIPGGYRTRSSLDFPGTGRCCWWMRRSRFRAVRSVKLGIEGGYCEASL